MAPRHHPRSCPALPYVPAIPETCPSGEDISSILSVLLPVAGVSARPAGSKTGGGAAAGRPTAARQGRT